MRGGKIAGCDGRPLDELPGKQIIREILYHVLMGPRGGAYLLVSRQTR